MSPNTFPIRLHCLLSLLIGFRYATQSIILDVEKTNNNSFKYSEGSTSFNMIEGMIIKEIKYSLNRGIFIIIDCYISINKHSQISKHSLDKIFYTLQIVSQIIDLSFISLVNAEGLVVDSDTSRKLKI